MQCLSMGSQGLCPGGHLPSQCLLPNGQKAKDGGAILVPRIVYTGLRRSIPVYLCVWLGAGKQYEEANLNEGVWKPGGRGASVLA